ncbi:MAG: 2-amino-4-hydroxy-6-hydroxymethyldihydropteridine diphosphokinase [Bacteroidia bacterium]|nr:2-amino-4-hydroxy-6-hydroxymethyldihydropteridine diphosphokinase [Bacteroidia bacterium]
MIFLGLGSNLGDKIQNLTMALRKMEAKGITILRTSQIIETAPWGVTNQDFFMNMVIEVKYEDTPEALLNCILSVETEMGRVREVKWGPRIIDIDIIDFHRQKINTDSLILPHPYYSERDFVMIPLRELEPDWEINPETPD